MTKNYWEQSIDQVLQDLNTNKNGLAQTEANSLLLRNGKNTIEDEKPRTAFSIFILQFKNPLVLILIGASIISIILKEHTDAIIIIAMVLLSTILSFIQEYRSEKALQKLRKKIALRSEVIRDNKIIEIPSDQIVLGDIIIISPGKIIPADLRLIEADNLQINESSLTGESFPVDKTIEPLRLSNPTPQKMKNIALMGTYAVQGEGKGVCIATAKDTEFGKTAKLLTAREETEFEKGFKNFGKYLIRIILVLAGLVFIVLSVLHQNYVETLLFALALALGISPELLPVALTLNLSRASRKMAQHSVIVKKLISVEDLGNTDIFCTDKTGTLTEGIINLTDYFNITEHHDKKILQFGYLCNSETSTKKVNKNQLDSAIVEFIKKQDIKFETKYQLIEEIPFDFKRRRMSVAVKNNGDCILICKGAFEEMMQQITQIESQNEIYDVKEYKQKIAERYEKLSKAGLKTLVIAYKKICLQKKYTPAEEKDLTFLGFLVFSDIPKESAKNSLATLKKLGAEIKILTGDNELVTQTVCQKLGLKVNNILLGEDLAKMTDEELEKQIPQTTIFARIIPEHKLKIIEILKKLGHTVGYLGDGINDAPALHAADVGISFKDATDVAKESAEIILLEKSLKVLANGIREGRKSFGNILKYIFVTNSSAVGNMISLAIASIFLPFIPLLPSQILLLNFLSDFPLLGLSTDSVDVEYLHKPKHWNIKAISRFTIYFGLISTIFDLLTFAFLIYIIKADVVVFRSAWFLESVLTELAVIFTIRTKRSFFKSMPSRALITISLFSLIATLFFVYSSFNHFFYLTNLSPFIILVVTAIVILYFTITEISKRIFYKRFEV